MTYDTSDIPQIVSSETEIQQFMKIKCLSAKTSFEYKIKPTDEWGKATVFSRAGKSTGKTSFG